MPKKHVNALRRQPRTGAETGWRAQMKRNLPLGFPCLLSFVEDGFTGLSELMFFCNKLPKSLSVIFL